MNHDSIVTVSELKDLNSTDDIAVTIDRIEYYKLLRKNNFSNAKATAKATEFSNPRRKLHYAINAAIKARQAIQRGEVISQIVSHREMHPHYLKSARIEREIFVNKKLPR
jgi:hypothetical protein